MSKNNTNQNNERNNNRGGNYNNRKKVAKQPKVNPNEIKAPLYLPADLNENIVNEIPDVLTGTRFNKISIPLNIRKCFLDYNVDENDTRTSTIGYIRRYNAETREFTVVIFSNFIDAVKEYANVAVEPQFTTYKDGLGTITKLTMVPVVYEDAPAEEVEE